MQRLEYVTKLVAGVLLLPTTLLLSGCYYMQNLTVPLETVQHLASESNRSERLLVFLPGLGDGVKVFSKQGLVDEVRSFSADIDIVAVNTHLKYFESRTVVDRLVEDVLIPARARGYKSISIVGISLGGFGALLILKHRPDLVDSVGLISPYLGDKRYYDYLLQEPFVESAIAEQRNLWPWLTRLNSETYPRIYLAYGTEDKFAIPGELLAAMLPKSNQVTVKGKHRWNTFTRAFSRLVSDTPFLMER
jgi:pimeloyl-ACP methyl ester carboxylesterase